VRHDDREISSIGELVQALGVSGHAGLTWYRGHARADWPLIPSIGRSEADLAAEFVTVKRFKQNAVPHVGVQPQNEWEWIFLMQHHRAPTRLLDWSESPLIGLYFALAEVVQDEHPASLWCLDPVSLNRLSGHNRTHAQDVLAFGIDPALDGYLPDQVNACVSQLLPVAAIGPRNSARMVAQSGTFTVMHAEAAAIETIDPGNHIWRLIIPPIAKAGLRQELRLLNITEFTVFPDLDRVALLARELNQ
jgi:hypothetical protein